MGAGRPEICLGLTINSTFHRYSCSELFNAWPFAVATPSLFVCFVYELGRERERELRREGVYSLKGRSHPVISR